MVTAKKMIRTIKQCRICGGKHIEPVIDLGSQYIASIFDGDDVADNIKKRYRLEVVRCAQDGGCGLVQLKHSISPDILYSHYGYLSGINEAMRMNLNDIVGKIEQLVGLNPNDIVVDIGCNDGTLLEFYQTRNLDKLGFDPSENVALIARGKGLDVICDYFSRETFFRARHGRKARVVTSIAMFYDLEDPGTFVKEIASILADDGVWVIELSYLPFMLSKNSYDTVCHEHLEYYTLRQITWMLDREHLKLHGIEFNDINGGSFRMFIRKEESGSVSDKVRQTILEVEQREDRLDLMTDTPYVNFREATEKVSKDLRSFLGKLTSDSKRIYIYGASTKGNTILQYCGIDNRLITKAADRNPDKWGRSTLGTGIPIISEEQARDEMPDYFLVLPWHFIDVFLKRELNYLEKGGKFILPLPEVRVIGIEDL